MLGGCHHGCPAAGGSAPSTRGKPAEQIGAVASTACPSACQSDSKHRPPTAVLLLQLQGEERMRQLGRGNPADDQTGLIAGLRVSPGLCGQACSAPMSSPSSLMPPQCTVFLPSMLLPSVPCALQGMVKVAVDQFLAGTDLFRLQLQQSMTGGCRVRSLASVCALCAA